MLQSYGLMGGEHCRTSTNDVIDDVDDSVSESLVEVNDYGDNVNDVDDSSRKMLVEVIDFGDNISRNSWMEGIPKSSTSHLSNCTDISHESSIKEHSKNLKHFVMSMYVSALHQTGSGAQGKLLPPPIAKPIKQNSETSHYMSRKFTSCLDNSLFKLWSSRKDAIKVSNSFFCYVFTSNQNE